MKIKEIFDRELAAMRSELIIEERARRDLDIKNRQKYIKLANNCIDLAIKEIKKAVRSHQFYILVACAKSTDVIYNSTDRSIEKIKEYSFTEILLDRIKEKGGIHMIRMGSPPNSVEIFLDLKSWYNAENTNTH